MGHKSLDQLQAGTINMFMIPGLIHLLLILTIIHDSYGGGTTVRGKVIYQGYVLAICWVLLLQIVSRANNSNKHRPSQWTIEDIKFTP